MKILSVLRKLGIIRYGVKAGAYKSGTDRPYEFMSDDIYNADEETVTKDDLKKVFSKDKPQANSESPKFCSKCGNELRAGAAFCAKCGNKIAATATTDASTPPAPPPPAATAETPAQETSPAPKTKKKSKKKIGCLVIVLLIVAAFIGLIALLMQDTMENEGARIQVTLENAVAYGSDTKIPKAPEKVTFKLYENHGLGFSTEMPEIWSSQSIRGSLVFSGPPTTEQERTTINLQAVARTDTTSLQQQAEELLGQLQSSEGYLLEGSALEVFRDTKAAYLLVSYDVNKIKFRQLQLIIERDQMYVFAAYTAPADIFDKYLYAMDHAIFTFKFIPIVAQQDTALAKPPSNTSAKKSTNGGIEELGRSIDDALQTLLGGSDSSDEN